MESNIDNFIKEICNKECGKYFESSKNYTFSKIRAALPSSIYSQKVFNRKLQISIAKITSPFIKKINLTDKNRFWILYYRLSEELITLKCNQSNYSTTDKMMCVEYILDRIIDRIKTFDIYTDSIPFQETKANIIQISEIYKSLDEIKLEINFKQLKHNSSVVQNYTKKILHKYGKDSMDSESIKAIIENALLSIEDCNSKRYQKNGEKSYIEKELLNYFNHDKKELEFLLEPVLIEIFHQEKFFNFIYNNFINSRFIDFTRTLSLKNKLPADELPINEPNSLGLDEILGEYLDMIPQETQLILQLKIGESLNNRDFIKLIYHFDYQEIDILGHFENEEILEIKFYARNNMDISLKTDNKISKIREKLKANSYINREEDTKRVILLKLIFSEEMSAKEIGVVLGYSDKQIYKKIESIKNKINNKKRLKLCTEA